MGSWYETGVRDYEIGTLDEFPLTPKSAVIAASDMWFLAVIPRNSAERSAVLMMEGRTKRGMKRRYIWCRVFAFFVHLLKLVTHKALMCCLFIHITHFQRAARGLLHAKCTSSHCIFVYTFRWAWHSLFSAGWTKVNALCVLTHALLVLLSRLFENLTRSFCATLVNQKYCLWGFWKSVVSVISKEEISKINNTVNPLLSSPSPLLIVLH